MSDERLLDWGCLPPTLRSLRDEALERAARAAEEYGDTQWAAKIRALKSPATADD